MRCEQFGCRDSKDKIGVLIANLGTPDAPTPSALRRYLRQFLWDPRVIETPRWLWWLILNGPILAFRPKDSAEKYRRIWTTEGSPLLKITERQTALVRERLTRIHPTLEVVFGMRYGSPSLEGAVDELRERGCSRILLFPMYPQYAAATTASTYDAVFTHILKERWVPTLRVAEPYYRHPLYVKALASTINDFYRTAERRPERLVLSYHGIPEKYVTKGDPYCCHCSETTQALLPWLQVPKEEVIHTYQSRFGKDPWLRPYTDITVEKLGDQGIKHLAVACPGFTADCLETLDEIGNEALEQFHEHGGETLKLIPCLNDAPVWIDAMSRIIQDEIQSWIATSQRDLAAGCCGTNPCPLVAAREEEQIASKKSSDSKAA